MSHHLLAALVAALFAAGCAGGSSVRATADPESGRYPTDEEPVVVAAPPESIPSYDDSTLAADSTADWVSPPSDRPSATEPPAGYAPYGNTGSSALERLGTWAHTGVRESRRLVVRSRDEWEQLWSELEVSGEMPMVDFGRDAVVVVSMGEQPSGGYDIRVAGMRETDAALVVDVVATKPGANCLSTGAISQPVDAVVIPNRAGRPIRFQERTEFRRCG